MSIVSRDFEGRRVVVTGGTGGIGWSCATQFAERGATVFACGYNEKELETVSAQGISGIHVRRLDVTDEVAVRSFFHDEPDLQRIGLDTLVNCAGIQTLGNAEETSLTAWNAIFLVNVTGTFLASKHALALLRKRGGGSIVNMSSIHARLTAGSRVAYVASKTALLGLTRAMALDHAAEKIRVNVILPGAIDTRMITEAWATLRPDRTADQMRQHVASVTPIGRMGEPIDIAAVVLFLSTDAASFITGAELCIDGGITQKLALPVTLPFK
jgi:NAD(P)-dependent dehydrogenase (short-subunit alcohol dehydrogenase family)